MSPNDVSNNVVIYPKLTDHTHFILTFCEGVACGRRFDSSIAYLRPN